MTTAIRRSENDHRQPVVTDDFPYFLRADTTRLHGLVMWFLYDPEDGLEEFATEDEAILAARCKIETYRDHGLQEWIDGVERIAVFQKVCGVRDASQVPEYQDWRIEPDCPLTQAEQDAIGL